LGYALITVGTLYLVATPIGNLEDFTGRAVKVLKQVGLIAAEDTRQTRKLLNHYKIHTPLISYYEHNKLSRLDEVMTALSQTDVALVSDAGTPALNDPGYELVRAALKVGCTVSPIPGPSAPLAALVASGLPTDAFLYLGYLPRKVGERRAMLEKVALQPYTLIFLESPHRLVATLEEAKSVLGDRHIAVARELTKLHEEIFRGCLSEALVHFSAQTVRGEITLVIEGNRDQPIWTEDQLIEALRAALGEGQSPAQAAAEIAGKSGWPRRTVYRRFTELQQPETKLS
jgi:16S rRNA (cytidine1402-2'-O)-methyltransferase